MVNSSIQNFSNLDIQAVSSESIVIMCGDTLFNYTNIVSPQEKFFSRGTTGCSGL